MNSEPQLTLLPARADGFLGETRSFSRDKRAVSRRVLRTGRGSCRKSEAPSFNRHSFPINLRHKKAERLMTQPIGFYTSYDPQTRHPGILDRIQQEWGSHLENMSYSQKIVGRAALAGYIALKPVWQDESNSISCIDACIESAGADYEIWDKDEFLVEAIQHCSQLDESDIEGLIEALSAQIRGRIYA